MYYEDSEHFGLVINNILAIGAARDCDVNDAIDNMWSICSCQSGFCNTSECSNFRNNIECGEDLSKKRPVLYRCSWSKGIY